MGFLMGLLGGLGGTLLGGTSVAQQIGRIGPGIPGIDLFPSGGFIGPVPNGVRKRRRRRRMLTASDIKDIAALAGLVGSSVAGKAALVRIARS